MFTQGAEESEADWKSGSDQTTGSLLFTNLLIYFIIYNDSQTG